MLKRITFTADERIIQKAKERAQKNGLTLNEIFQSWLYQYVKNIDEYDKIMQKLNYASSGGKYTRDQLNER